jgi:hypothetical protein
MDVYKVNKIVIQDLLDMSFSRKSIAEKRQIIKNGKPSSFFLISRVWKRTIRDWNFILNYEQKMSAKV